MHPLHSKMNNRTIGKMAKQEALRTKIRWLSACAKHARLMRRRASRAMPRKPKRVRSTHAKLLLVQTAQRRDNRRQTEFPTRRSPTSKQLSTVY